MFLNRRAWERAEKIESRVKFQTKAQFDEEDSIPKPKLKHINRTTSSHPPTQEGRIKKKKKKKKPSLPPSNLNENDAHTILASAAPKASERVEGDDDSHSKQLNRDGKVDETDHDDDMFEEEHSKHKHKDATHFLNPVKDGEGKEENNEENEDEQVDETDDDTQKAHKGEGEDDEYDPSSQKDKDVVEKAQNMIKKKKSKLSLAGVRGSKVNQVWSSDDKVAILKGMIDFKKKEGSLPDSKTVGSFHEFIRNSITAGTNTEQLWNKIRKLKGAYLNKVPKLDTHQNREAFKLSKIIWGAKDVAIVRAKDGGIVPAKEANKRKLKEGKVGMVKRLKCEKENGTSDLNKEPVTRGNYASKNIDELKRFWERFPHYHAILDLEFSGLSEVERNREMELMMNIDHAKIREMEETLITYQINERNFEIENLKVEIKNLNVEIENLKLDKKRLYVDKESDDVEKKIKSLRSSVMELRKTL